jgi:hypothetical protein
VVRDRGPLFAAIGAEYPVPCRKCAAADPAGCPGGLGCRGQVVVGWDLADRRVFARVERDGAVHTGWWRRLDPTTWAQPEPEQTRHLVAGLRAQLGAYAELPVGMADLLTEAVRLPWAGHGRATSAAPVGPPRTEVVHINAGHDRKRIELGCKLAAIDAELDRLRAAMLQAGEIIACVLGNPAVLKTLGASHRLTDAMVFVVGLPVAILELRRLVGAARDQLDLLVPVPQAPDADGRRQT